MASIQNEFPILSYLLSQVDPNSNSSLPQDVYQSLFAQFPHLSNPKLLPLLSRAIPATAVQAHSLIKTLGCRPDPSAVSVARSEMIQLGEEKKNSEIEIYKAVIRLEEMHEQGHKQLREAEERLVGVYKEVVTELEDGQVNEEVVAILRKAESGGVVERVDLSGRQLSLIPEKFSNLHQLIWLDLSRNQIQVLPDSISRLQKLEQLDVSSNLLDSLPDSIGLLPSLKILNVFGNKLQALPESIALCRSLVELDASFNNLMSLPTNIGYGLVNLEKLSIQLNKIRFLPTSICEMKSLKYLDVHFNELCGLPHAIGRLTNLEVLNLSSNFSDLTELPETVGDLTNLRELDLSNNQIRALPDTFGRLGKLIKLNLEENPIVIPPKDVVCKGVEAVREFMVRRWEVMIAEEQQRSIPEANQQQAQSGWLAWGTSLLTNMVTGVSQSISGHLRGGKAPRDPYLDQLL
ncbi:hypothetical protein K2173_005771 [Erythroxylum novogranatense]|uniref:Plant intracellular Ras-group-related LRR protein 3 n=1 Tax=Erythroxylum novogranatense TaxID=1862640 RepID=A0AAV8U5D3_9ROSI|nr:hypothetical protein K2173_005771 [Erythroxylum novogranatense]